MGCIEKSKNLFIFSVFNLAIHAALLGVLIWYLIFRLEKDLNTATFPVTVGGIVVDVSLDNVGSLVDDGGSGDAQAKLETLLLLVIRLVGLIPVGIGTISSILIILGYICCRKSSQCGYFTSSIFATIASILYIILVLASVGLIVVINDKKVVALLQETVDDLDVTSLVSGATSDLDAVLKRERRQALDLSQLDTDSPNDLLEALQDSEFGSLISSIDVDALDAAIGDDVDLTSFFEDGMIDLSDEADLEQLSDALADVDLSQTLDNLLSNVAGSLDVEEILDDSGIRTLLQTVGIVGIVVFAVLAALEITLACFGCNSKLNKTNIA